jgi:TPR repeat protein
MLFKSKFILIFCTLLFSSLTFSNSITQETLTSEIIKCEDKVSRSCIDVGFSYLIRYDNPYKALDYFKNGCDLGNPYGCENYGFVLLYILNDTRGVKYLKNSCYLNEDFSCLALYVHYKSVDINLKKAKVYWNKYCNLGKDNCSKIRF